MENKENIGTLYIVGTPIGNLGDITYRAVETLKNVDIILAEDTRQTLKLLNYFDIKKKMISYHRHNENEKMNSIVGLLNDGYNVALVSDAGMPIISDPGQYLIKFLTKNNYKIEVVPGVTALITAIVKSGMDSTRFTFEGFLSVNKKQRKERLESLLNEARTMIFYEAPHKILYTLKDMEKYFENRNICIARELTKLHEEFKYTTIKEAIEDIEINGIKGELVIIVEGKIQDERKINKISYEKSDIIDMVTYKIKDGIDKKDAIKSVAKELGLNKNEVYKLCIDINL